MVRSSSSIPPPHSSPQIPPHPTSPTSRPTPLNPSPQHAHVSVPYPAPPVAYDADDTGWGYPAFKYGKTGAQDGSDFGYIAEHAQASFGEMYYR